MLASNEEEAVVLANDEARRQFDLSEGPLLRCLVVSIGSADHLLVLNVHHIIADGWSSGILLRDLGEAYTAMVEQREPWFEPLTASYFAHAVWQKTQTKTGSVRNDLGTWIQDLRGAPALLDLPTDHARPSVMTYSGARAVGRISGRVRRMVEALAARELCTPFAVLLAAWQAVLHRYTGQDDIVVGMPVAGRNHPLVEKLVGCFVNTLAIRMAINGDTPFVEHLHSVHKKIGVALSHQDLPFEILVAELGLERDLSRSPIFQVMLVLQNAPSGDFTPAQLSVTHLPLHNGGAKFDLVLEITPEADGYRLALEFNTSVFLPETAARILRHFSHFLTEACRSPEAPLAGVRMMDDEEIRQMLSFVNRDQVSFDDVECLHRRFERQVRKTPHAIALTFEATTLRTTN